MSSARDTEEAMRARVETLRRQVADLSTQVTALDAERAALRTEIERSKRTMAEQCAIVEQQNATLVNLYVASHRLHESLDRREVLSVIQEIIANLIGSEEMAVYELGPDRQELELVWAFGVDEGRLGTLSAHRGLIGRAVGTGEIFVAGSDGCEEALEHESELTACIPLSFSGAVTGVIAVFRLLEQKPTLTGGDRELFELLSTQAATALHCTALHARFHGEGIGTRSRGSA